MIFSVSVRSTLDDRAPAHLRQLVPDLATWKRYYVEVEGDRPSPPDVDRLASTFGDQMTQQVTVDEPLVNGRQVEVAYKRGIVDNESDSIVALARMLDVPALAAKVATVYESADPGLALLVDAQACNHVIEELHEVDPVYDSLLPYGDHLPPETYDLRRLDDVELAALGTAGGRVLELDKMQRIRDVQRKLGLDVVTDVMLEAFDSRWNDHCAHTTWKSLGNLLGRLVSAAKACDNPSVVSMFHDNAGVWRLDDEWGIALKAETHNGPSAVSAYFGQLTKVGGVLRDILGTGLGADPIGVIEYTATGLPESPSPIAGRPTSKQIANETVRAVKEYGNTFGVPMMASRMTFHEAYRAKPFALGGAIGLVPLRHATKGRPQAGDHVVLIGGLTGNDGVHGGSGSSAGATMDATSVQIGSPLEAIKFREAILELRDADGIRAITDLGAAGLNSAVGEMGDGVGVWLNTALVPLKTGGLPMWRILVSESQERMALAVAPAHLDLARRVFDRHDVRCTVVGRFTGDDRYRVVWDARLTENDVVLADVSAMPEADEVGVNVPYELLDYTPPPRPAGGLPHRQEMPSAWPDLPVEKLAALVPVEKLAALVPQVLADGEVASQQWASVQYDSSVQARTFYGPTMDGPSAGLAVPTGYYAGRPVYGSDRAVVVTTAFDPWLFDAHPVRAARQMFVSAVLGQVLAGVRLLDICLADNFYTPHLGPDADAWLVGMVDELAALSRRFRIPFISGKDSSAGSTHTDEGVVSVPPGVFITALGVAADASLLRNERWQTAGNLLVRIGLSTPSLAGTVAARVFGLSADDADEVSVDDALAVAHALAAVSLSVVPSGRRLGAGGLLAAATYGSIASGLGAELESATALRAGASTADAGRPGQGRAAALLAEHRCAVLVEIKEEDVALLPDALAPVVVGRIVDPRDDGAPSVRLDGVELLTPDAVVAWQHSFEERLR